MRQGIYMMSTLTPTIQESSQMADHALLPELAIESLQHAEKPAGISSGFADWEIAQSGSAYCARYSRFRNANPGKEGTVRCGCNPRTHIRWSVTARSTGKKSPAGGRPRRLGYGHVLVIRRRCQRRIVPGVTTRCRRSICGNLRTSAANTARSAQSSRGVGWGSAQHGDFVAQHQEFEILGR